MLDQAHKEVAVVLQCWYNTSSSRKCSWQCTLKFNKSKQPKNCSQEYQNFSFYLPATAQGQRKSCGELLTQSWVVHLELNKRKRKQKQLQQEGGKCAAFLSFIRFHYWKKSATPAALCGSQSSVVDVETQREARDSSDIPCSTCGLGSLSTVRKAQGINLEEAAAASCSQTTRCSSIRKLNQLCAGSKGWENCSQNFQEIFCHLWGKPALNLEVCVTHTLF